MSFLGNKSIRCISKVLIITILLTLVPHNAFADSNHESVHYFAQKDQIDVPAETVTRIGEITAKRERNKKYFLNSDSSIGRR